MMVLVYNIGNRRAEHKWNLAFRPAYKQKRYVYSSCTSIGLSGGCANFEE